MRPFSPSHGSAIPQEPYSDWSCHSFLNLPPCISIFLVSKLFLNPSLNHSHSPLKTFTPCFIHSGHEEEIILILLDLFPMHLKTFIISPLRLTPFKLKTN